MTVAPRSAAEIMRRNNVRLLGRQNGPAMVFAHGFGCDQAMWARIVPHFLEDHRIVLLDHVGSGDSDIEAYDPVKYASLDGYVCDLLQICETLELSNVVVVAHSISATMAIAAAVQQPDRFSHLVLVAPSPYYLDDPDDDYVGGFVREEIDDLLHSLERNYFAWAASLAPMVMGNPDDPGLAAELTTSFCRTDPQVARDFARVTFLTDSRALLPQVHTPTLVLQCSEDMLAPASVGRYVHEQVEGSRLVQLAATGHCPHVSAPDETAAAIRDYLGTAS